MRKIKWCRKTIFIEIYKHFIGEHVPTETNSDSDSEIKDNHHHNNAH